MGSSPPAASASRLPHVLAWAMACGTLFLIWVGGQVTTYGAGMAVPDWPNTYGYNLFLYPLESWLGVWDVFLEHSHRLIGATVGMICIGLVASLALLDRRRWMVWLGVVALVGVCFQGLLGGLRVLGNDVFLAKVHGCTAPVFFGLSAALVTFTSPAWRRGEIAAGPAGSPPRGFATWTVLAAGLIYLQIVFGANLRHMPLEARKAWFELWVWLHVVTASLVLLGAVVVWRLAARRGLAARLRRRAGLLAGLVVVQVLFGLGSWVVKYGFPGWFIDHVWAVEYTVVAKSRLQTLTITTHVGIGSLCLAAAVCLSLWALYEHRHTSTAA